MPELLNIYNISLPILALVGVFSLFKWILSNGKNYSGNIKVHFFYIVLILALIIVLLVSVKWTDIPKFTEYISTAATFTSLILGMLAIIYAYISNDTFSKSVSAISVTSQDMLKATEGIKHANDTIKDSNAGAQKLYDNLNHVTFDIVSQLKTMRETSDALHMYSDKLTALVSPIPEKIEILDKKIGEFFRAEFPRRKKENGADSPVNKDFMPEDSYMTLLCAYMCKKSHETGKSFQYSRFIGDSAKAFMVCFLDSYEKFGELSYTIENEKAPVLKSEIKIVELSALFNNINDLIVNKIENTENDGVKNKWKKQIKMITDYFESDNDIDDADDK